MKTRRKKIFITGGAGFIGANLVKYLLDKGGFDITVYDNLSACCRKSLLRAIDDSKKKGKVKFIRADILNLARLTKAIKGHSLVIHLAAHARVVESLKDPKENFTINTLGTFNVLEAARRAGRVRRARPPRCQARAAPAPDLRRPRPRARPRAKVMAPEFPACLRASLGRPTAPRASSSAASSRTPG